MAEWKWRCYGSNGDSFQATRDDSDDLNEKIRMLELELELTKLKSATKQSTRIEPERPRTLRLQEVVELLPEFNPSKVSGLSAEQWIEKVETLRDVYEIGEKLLIMAVGSKLKGTASLWWESWFDKGVDWTSFVAEFGKSFQVHVTQAEICERLRNRVRNKQQSYMEYCLEMRLIAKKRIEEDSLIRYIISGINDRELQSGLLSRGVQSFEELRKFVSWYASMEGTVAGGSGRNVEAATTSRPTLGGERTRMLRERSGQCFNCFEEGHIAINCSKPRRKPQCNVCSKIGHLSKDCPNRKKVYQIETKTSDTMGSENGPTMTRTITTDAEGMVAGRLVVDGESLNTKILVDSGAAVSLAKNITLNKSELFVNNDVLSGVNGCNIEILGKKSAQVQVNDNDYDIDLYVVPNGTMSMDVIAGRDFLRKNGIKQIVIGNENDLMKYDMQDMNEVVCMNVLEEVQGCELNIGDNNDTKKWEKEINKIFFDSYVSREKPSEPLVKHEAVINLKTEKVFKVSPQRFSVYEKQEMNKIVNDYLEKGIIRESDSPYSSRVVLTKKRNGSMRMCINYRQLNKLVEKNCYPMPVVEDQVMKLHGKKYFSTLDLKNGFYHVPLDENSKKYTAFVTESGQYEFNRLPFGFRNSPPEFAKFISKVLRKLIMENKLVVFIDDILVSTVTVEEHIQVLEELFQTLSDNHIELQLKKCEFLRTEIEYLGYRVSFNRISPSGVHIDAVKDYPIPTNKKAMQRFLGLVGYFRKFIKGFNDMAGSLYELLKSDNEYLLEEKHMVAIERLKEAMCKKPVLAIYSQEKETQLHTDASSAGFGGILMQKEENGYFHPVMYFSRKCTAAESKLHSFELETLAIVYSLKRFRPYLFGKSFTIVTDCNSLKQTLDKKDINSKIARWSLYLEEFDYETEHRSAERMKHVDALSRNWIYMVEEEDGEGDGNLDRIYVGQLRDKNLQKLKDLVEKGKKEGYEIRNGIVYRKEKGRLQLVVPNAMIESILNQFHGRMGHFGAEKVCELIRRNFFFSKMKERVQEHINDCLVCVLYNPKPHLKEVDLMSIPKAITPFDTIHIDHLGPIELTKSKNLHILVIVDAFTKFVKIYPTKTTNATEVVKWLKDYVENYSVPKRVISDRGTAFSSKEFKKLVDNWGVKHIQVAVACPRANGQVERYNRTLIPLISKLVYENKTDWDKVLKRAEFLLNNTESQAIKQTPAVSLFGVKQRFDNRGVEECVQDMVGAPEVVNREEMWNNMSENIIKQQKTNERYYNRKVKKPKVKLKEGDLVLVRARKIPGEANKLRAKFKGPYQIGKVLDSERYVVQDIDNYQVSGKPFNSIFDRSNLKKYPEKQLGESDSESEDEGDQEAGYGSDVSVWFDDWDPEEDSSICMEEVEYDWDDDHKS